MTTEPNPTLKRAKELIELIQSECEILNADGKRIVANRIHEVIEPWMRKQANTSSPYRLEPMTDQECGQFEAERVEFGKYAGATWAEVPFDYMAWLADSSRELSHKLRRYLHNPTIERMVEAESDEE